MEEEILDYYGDIKQRDPPQQMYLIQKDDLFDVSALDAIRFPGWVVISAWTPLYLPPMLKIPRMEKQ